MRAIYDAGRDPDFAGVGKFCVSGEFERRYPAIAAWCERIRALPGYERTYPPHWRAAPQPAAAAS